MIREGTGPSVWLTSLSRQFSDPTLMTASPIEVFPRASSQSQDCMHVVLVAEGFPSSELPTFTAATESFGDTLLGTPPFSLLRSRPGRVRVWSVPTESTDHGVALGTTPGNT